MDQFGESTSFDSRNVLTDRIDFLNSRSALEKRPGGLLLILQAQALDGTTQQRRSAPGNETKNQVCFLSLPQQPDDGFSGRDACLIRDRVTRLYNFYFSQRNPMPSFDNDDTAGNPFAQQPFHR